MEKDLLEYCYKHRKEYVYDTSQREFDCLLELVESGTVSSFEELAEYGMEYEKEYEREFKVGDKVEVVHRGSSINPEGSVGIVTRVDGQECIKVVVEGIEDYANWHSNEELELIEE